MVTSQFTYSKVCQSLVIILHERKCIYNLNLNNSAVLYAHCSSDANWFFFCHFLLCFPSVSLNRESKDNQWLGVTVKSQGIGGKVVVSKDHIL